MLGYNACMTIIADGKKIANEIITVDEYVKQS